MEIAGIIYSLFGALVMSFGSGKAGAMEDVASSLSMYGYNLETARAKGKQRVSIKVGTVMYMFGIIASLYGASTHLDSHFFWWIAITIGILTCLIHFLVLVPRQSKLSMLATLKYYYFSRDKGMEDTWEKEAQNDEWCKKLLRQLGLSEDLTKDELKKEINDIKISFAYSTGPRSPSTSEPG